jgi:hypothetical protein
MEREMDELKRRLHDVENERDTVQTQLNHYSALGQHAGPTHTSKDFESFQKKLENVASKLRFLDTTREEEDEGSESNPRLLPHASSQGRASSEKGRASSEKKRTKGHRVYKDIKKLQEKEEQFYQLGSSDAEYLILSDRPLRPTVVGSNGEETQASFSEPVRIQRKSMANCFSRNTRELSHDTKSMNYDGPDEELRVPSDQPSRLIDESHDKGESLGTRKFLRDKRRPYLARDCERIYYGPLSSTKKTTESKKNKSHGESSVELESSKSGICVLETLWNWGKQCSDELNFRIRTMERSDFSSD